MKAKWVIAMLLGAGTAYAQPNLSQHPRMGELGRVQFVDGTARMAFDPSTSQRNHEVLGEVAAWARQNPDGTLELHCSSSALGLERANAVRARLIELGIDSDRIAIISDRGAAMTGVSVIARLT